MLMRLFAYCVVCVFTLGAPAFADDRPNILWISCEDISPRLGCYGDKQAITPNLDQLASEGVRFTRAHHIHGVCAPARTGIITGMYPTALGCNHMRCHGKLPDHVKPFPHYLKEAGYYTTNNAKTDYNFAWNQKQTWHENSGKAHWRKRPDKDMPFFSVFNLTVSHESRVWEHRHRGVTKNLDKDKFHDPAKVPMPPYYPDTEKARASMARLYDIITVMDQQVGRILKQLEEDGLADDTIVVFWSDHGDGLPRAKRWIYDSGTHVPMIVRIPEKFRRAGYGKASTTDDRLTSMIDLGPTMLTLAGLDVPDHMHGRTFIDNPLPEGRKYIHGARDRIDERFDMVRMVRDTRYRYVRNYAPQFTWLRLIGYAENNAIRQEMRRLLSDGKLKPESAQWFAAPRPYEELYDTQADPHEINNLAADPAHADTLQRLRAECDRWMTDVRDVQFYPEPFLEEADKQQGYRRSLVEGDAGAERLEPVMHAARAAANAGRYHGELLQLSKAGDPVVRWWAAMGLHHDGISANQAIPALRAMLDDDHTAVRVAAAWSLNRRGADVDLTDTLKAGLTDRNSWTRYWAAQVCDEMDKLPKSVLDLLEKAKKDSNNYVTRLAKHRLSN